MTLIEHEIQVILTTYLSEAAFAESQERDAARKKATINVKTLIDRVAADRFARAAKKMYQQTIETI